MAETGCLRDAHVQNLEVAGTLTNKVPVVALTVATTLLTSQTGSYFTIDAAGGAYTITLPTIGDSSGVRYQFVVTEDTPTGAVTIAAGAAIIFGNFAEAEVDTSDDGPGSSGATGISNIIIGTGARKGLRFGLWSNGTNWFLVDALSQIDAAITTS
jgi:hypothetical protein